MATKYLSSGSIKVFPSGYRDAGIDLDASRTTEESMTRIVRAPLSSTSFAKVESDNSLTLVIKGYVFSIPGGIPAVSALFPNPTAGAKIYASIITSDSLANMAMLVNSDDGSATLDSGGEFKGVKFDSSSGDFLVLKYESGAWGIPQESKLNSTSGQISDGLSNKSISQEFHSGTMYASNLYVSGLSYDDSPVILAIGEGDDPYKVYTVNLEYDYELPEPAANNVPIISSIEEDSLGRLAVGRRNLPLASTSDAGLVSTNAQTFAGAKTFNGKATFKDEVLVAKALTASKGISSNDSIAISANDNTKGITMNGSDAIALLTPASISMSNTSSCWTTATTQGVEAYNAEVVSKYAYTALHLKSINIGSGICPIYIDGNGKPAAFSQTVGDSDKPVYLNQGAITALSSTIGAYNQPVYMSSGKITAFSGTIGGEKRPVWVDGGVLKPITSSIGGTKKPIYVNTSGNLTAFSSSEGNKNTPVYLNSGTITSTGVAIDSAWVHLDSVTASSVFAGCLKSGRNGSGSVVYYGYDAMATIIGKVVTINMTCKTSIADNNWVSIDIAKLLKALFTDNTTSEISSGRRIYSVSVKGNYGSFQYITSVVSNRKTNLDGFCTLYVTDSGYANNAYWVNIGGDEGTGGQTTSNGWNITISFPADILWDN